ncbi:HTTM domain-containing protein [Parapedobacter sp. 2B3]|uniref:HTTM domain-containing protein n=1 Tax=Parapedobacter sp. 2B3 TaxID=3342381 RepID=UPI0035B6969B
MNRFLFETPLHPSAIRLLHRGTGTLLAVQFLLLLPDMALLYGADGIIDPELLPARSLLLSTSVPLSVIASGYILLSVLLALGRLPWAGVLVLLVLHGAWHTRGSAFSYGVDYVSASALFYCLCTPRARPAWHTPALRLLQLHMCIIYFFGGLAKSLGATWWNGEALWKALGQPYHLEQAPAVVASLASYPWLWAVGGGAVVMLELCYPLFIWFGRTRPYWLWAIVGMHVGIALFIGLFQFAAIMILLNLVAFHFPYRADTEQPVHPSHKHPSPPWWAFRKRLPTPARDTTKGGTDY